MSSHPTIQHLPPQQRAVLIARDVLEWPAAQTADLLEMSVASPADAAIDTLIRNLAMECGPAGVRVLGVWAAGYRRRSRWTS